MMPDLSWWGQLIGASAAIGAATVVLWKLGGLALEAIKTAARFESDIRRVRDSMSVDLFDEPPALSDDEKSALAAIASLQETASRIEQQAWQPSKYDERKSAVVGCREAGVFLMCWFITNRRRRQLDEKLSGLTVVKVHRRIRLGKKGES